MHRAYVEGVMPVQMSYSGHLRYSGWPHRDPVAWRCTGHRRPPSRARRERPRRCAARQHHRGRSRRDASHRGLWSGLPQYLRRASAVRLAARGPRADGRHGPPDDHPRAVQLIAYDIVRASRVLPRLLRRPGPPACAQLAAGAARRPDAALHQCGHEPVQGRVPRPGTADVFTGDHLAEVHARQWEAQRPRQRRPFAPPPHVLRDAGELLLRRLLQAGRDCLRLGVADDRVGAAAGSPVRDDLQGRVGNPARRRGVCAVERLRAGRPHPRAGRERQLLVDGRDRPVRTVQRAALRPRGGALRGTRMHPRSLRDVPALARDLEPRLHAVRPSGRWNAHPAAEAVRSTRAWASSASRHQEGTCRTTTRMYSSHCCSR